jgi:hypothetical protein
MIHATDVSQLVETAMTLHPTRVAFGAHPAVVIPQHPASAPVKTPAVPTMPRAIRNWRIPRRSRAATSLMGVNTAPTPCPTIGCASGPEPARRLAPSRFATVVNAG